MIVTILGSGDIGAKEKLEDGNEKSRYIVIADDEMTYNQVIEEVGENEIDDGTVFEKNYVIITEMSDRDAEMLDKEEGVLVEEDCFVAANSKKETRKMKKKLLAKVKKGKSKGEKRRTEWNLQAINAADLADETEDCSEKVKVALLDSGVDYTTGIELAGSVNLVDEEDGISPMFQDLTGHGTSIASIIHIK